jgi:hypothetical protein
MLPIVRLAHHRDPEAIAEIVRHHLQCLNTENLEEGIGIADLEVKASIDDSSLDLQIHTNSVLDKEKLLTLVRTELQNLQIESVAKVRIHCWRKDEEFDQTTDEELIQPSPLWTEQFMLEPSRLFKYQDLGQDLDLAFDNSRSPEAKITETKIPEAKLPETRASEPQLSKHSVLQQAIAQIAATSDHAKKHLVAEVLTPIDELEIPLSQVGGDASVGDVRVSVAALKPDSKEKHQEAIDNNYWQLLLVGGSIVLLGLGIGAVVRAATLKNLAEKPLSVLKAPEPLEIAPTAPALEIAPTASSSPVNPSPYNVLETPTPNISELPISSSPLPSTTYQKEQTVTLEKFNLVEKGMSIEQVERILGISGRIIAETNMLDSVGQVYSWKNADGSNAIVEFKDGQVVAKAQAGL